MAFNPGDVVTVEFPGVQGTKRRPAVVLSSAGYHAVRPDTIIGLVTTQIASLTTSDCLLQDWSVANLRAPSAFRSFLVTLPPAANFTYVGRLSARDWEEVRACVKFALTDL